jgi:hypothetical protein
MDYLPTTLRVGPRSAILHPIYAILLDGAFLAA